MTGSNTEVSGKIMPSFEEGRFYLLKVGSVFMGLHKIAFKVRQHIELAKGSSEFWPRDWI